MADVLSGIITSPNAPLFEGVYNCYDHCFTLPEEKAPKQDFVDVLTANSGPELEERKSRVGTDARYFAAYLQDPVTKEIIGGATFDVFKGCCDPKYDGTVHLSYLFTDPKHRNPEYARKLLNMVDEASQAFCREGSDSSEKHLLCFSEQNAPTRMTVGQYKADEGNAGVNSCDRRPIAEMIGKFKTLRMHYIQPPFVSGGDQCDYLDLSVRGLRGESVSADVIRQHLERFYADLFPEGTSLNMTGLEPMNAALQPGKNITTMKVGRAYSLAKNEVHTIVAGKSPDTVIGEHLRSETLQGIDTHAPAQQVSL